VQIQLIVYYRQSNFARGCSHGDFSTREIDLLWQSNFTRGCSHGDPILFFEVELLCLCIRTLVTSMGEPSYYMAMWNIFCSFVVTGWQLITHLEVFVTVLAPTLCHNPFSSHVDADLCRCKIDSTQKGVFLFSV
jgi:hypothetical protein